jgi:hypothetical protein
MLPTASTVRAGHVGVSLGECERIVYENLCWKFVI